jgi:type VI secretion system secreted protein VgrG
MNDVISIASSVLPGFARVIGFRGIEAISRPYEIEIFLAFRDREGDAVDLADAVGAKATLTIDRAADAIPPFIFAGIFSSVELLHELDGHTLIRAVLVPALWVLGLSRHSRIFTKVAFPDVLKSVLEDNSIGPDEYELRLGSYEVEEHICQYRESDLDFLSRWMEREGIYYFFEHTTSGEKLIISDAKPYEDDPIGTPVRYHPQVGHDVSAGSSFRSFTSQHKTLPSMVSLKDYDYTKPNLDVSGSANVSKTGLAEVNQYGERFFTPGAGDRLAKLRSEEMLARQVVYHAAGTRLHLRPGYTFDLEEHSRDALNTTYLTVETHHHGNQAAGSSVFQELLNLQHSQVYFVEITAIAAKTQFRAESRTPWPRIYGYENGNIEGPAESEYAQIDEQGRYRVKLKFDESNLKGARASTFVRMMQPHGGGIEGFHFPLRKGTEVVLSFLGGDPDRPVISGVVPNVLTPSPVTSANHTKNVIQTGGRNRFELDDKNGQQQIVLSTPYSNTYLSMGVPNDHELTQKTDDNALYDAGKNFDLRVGQNGGGTWDAKIKDNWITHVQSGVHEFYVEAGSSYTEVKGDTWLHVTSGNLFIDVDAGTMTTKVKGNTSTTVVSGNYSVIVNAGNTLIDTQAGTTDIKSKSKLTISTDASCDFKVKANLTVSVDGSESKEIKGSEELKTFGAFKKLYVSNNVNVTGGMKSDTFLGISNTNAIGASVATFVGAKAVLEASAAFSATFAVKLDIVNGASLSYKMGVAATVNAAVEFTAKPIKARAYGTVVGTMGNKIINHLIKLETAATHIIT